MSLRFRLPVGRTVLVGCLSLLALLASLPLAIGFSLFAFDSRGLTARGASGSIWGGQLHEARLGPVPLGSPHVRLSAWRLLFGDARLYLLAEREGGLSGAISSSRTGLSLKDINGELPLSALVPGEAGTVTLINLAVTFEDGRCLDSSGAIDVDGPGASASIVCAGDTARARLDGLAELVIDASGQASVKLL